MRFNKRTHKVIPSSLTKEEAREFLYFLQDEGVRHRKCVFEAEFYGWMIPLISQIYYSASTRHEEDIRQIDLLIEKVKARFGL